MWDWLLNSDPIPGGILTQLQLSESQTALVRSALDDMVRERSGGSGHAVLTSPINIGVATM